MTELERKLLTLLNEIYPLLRDGTFYDDYDNAIAMVGRVHSVLTEVEPSKH